MTIDEMYWELVANGTPPAEADLLSREHACFRCNRPFNSARDLAAHNIREHK